jgi:hypothetical protein
MLKRAPLSNGGKAQVSYQPILDLFWGLFPDPKAMRTAVDMHNLGFISRRANYRLQMDGNGFSM